MLSFLINASSRNEIKHSVCSMKKKLGLNFHFLRKLMNTDHPHQPYENQALASSSTVSHSLKTVTQSEAVAAGVLTYSCEK